MGWPIQEIVRVQWNELEAVKSLRLSDHDPPFSHIVCIKRDVGYDLILERGVVSDTCFGLGLGLEILVSLCVAVKPWIPDLANVKLP